MFPDLGEIEKRQVYLICCRLKESLLLNDSVGCLDLKVTIEGKGSI